MTPDLKLLKSLADTCRKAGITSFEGFGYKFNIDLDSYKPRKRSSQQSDDVQEDEQMDWDSLTDEQKLFYSSAIPEFE